MSHALQVCTLLFLHLNRIYAIAFIILNSETDKESKYLVINKALFSIVIHKNGCLHNYRRPLQTSTDHHRHHYRPQCKLLTTHKINISTSKM